MIGVDLNFAKMVILLIMLYEHSPSFFFLNFDVILEFS